MIDIVTTMRRTTLEEAFEYWVEVAHRDDETALNRSQAYLEYLCDSMTMRGN